MQTKGAGLRVGRRGLLVMVSAAGSVLLTGPATAQSGHAPGGGHASGRGGQGAGGSQGGGHSGGGGGGHEGGGQGRGPGRHRGPPERAQRHYGRTGEVLGGGVSLPGSTIGGGDGGEHFLHRNVGPWSIDNRVLRR
jgi:hypothetical protein